MNISDFKAQHPDYADVPDLELADALHKKFYAEVPRAEFFQKVGLADAGGDLSVSMPRDAYAKRFMADNPQAKPEALDAVLAQYDQQQGERKKTGLAAAEDRFALMNSPGAAFNARLDAKMAKAHAGALPSVAGRISSDAPHLQTPANRLREELAHELAVERGENPTPLPPSNVNPADYEAMLRPRDGGPGTVLSNAALGLASTAMGVTGTGAALLGNDKLAAEMDAARAQGAEAARLNGGGTIVGKASNLAGAILPAMASGGAGLVPELAGNAGIFGAPAARDAYREQKAKGASEAVAVEHALAAMGINTALPMIAPGGSRAITKLLGGAEAAGLKGAGIQLGQAAGEGAGFAVANSVAHKGIDAANGIDTDAHWVDWKELPSEALAFAALRGAHVAGHGVGAVASAVQRAREQRALIDNIGKAGSVDEAIAAATAAVSTPATDNVADILQQIRPLEPAAEVPAAPRAPVDALGRVGPTMGEAPQSWADAVGTPAEMGRKYVRVQDADGSTRMAPAEEAAPSAWEQANQGASHEAAPAEGSIGATGDPAAVRPGPAVSERPAPAGPGDVRAPQVDAVPGPAGGADPVRSGAAGKSAPAIGEGWHAFPEESGTLNIPRAEMPQVKSEHRGALVNFLKARGIEHEQVELPAESLKPTQAEFNLEKVQNAHDYQGGERSILVSADGHVLDGHHQWLASVEKGEPVKAIRLNAPIKDLLEQVKEFPSATTAEGAPQHTQEVAADVPQRQEVPEKASVADGAQEAPAAETAAGAALGKGARIGRTTLEAARDKHQRQDDAVRQAAENITKRKASGGQRARERVKLENPLLHFLANHGVHIEERSDTGGDKGRAGNPMIPGFGPLYRKSGLRMDELANLAHEAGFLSDHDMADATDNGGTRKLAELIERAAHRKEAIDRPAAADAGAPSADARLLEEAQRLGVDTTGKSADELYDAVKAAHDAEEARREQVGTASIDEQAKIERQTDKLTTEEIDAIGDLDILLDGGKPDEHLNDEALDAIFGKQSRSTEVGAGKTEKDPTGAADESAARSETAGEGTPELLTGYTREDVLAREQAASDKAKQKAAEREKLEAQRKKEADDKDVRARMDDSADNFQLGQDAHDSLAGQQDIFSQPAPTGEPSASKTADPLEGVPRTFMRKLNVDRQVYDTTTREWKTVSEPASTAIKAVREDIQNLEALLKCMKG